jgi:class 3 adenylate cyclase
MAILFSATYPERTWALVLEGASARELWAPDYPWGWREEEYERDIDEELERWGTREHSLEILRGIAPSLAEEEHEAAARLIRQSASPGAAAALARMNRQIDVRHALPAIQTPTLVLNRAAESPFIVESSRYLGERIPGAAHVEVPGSDHAHFASDAGPTLDAIERFLTDASQRPSEEAEPDRVLATVLFTDIVGSSEKVVTLGDRAWRELLERHHGLVRRQLARFRGREVDTAGDGFFASFDGPARAIRCACAIVDGVRVLGLEVRAGLHTGECELANGKVAGIAVHTGARVAAHAGPGEVLVSSTVRDLVAGSGLAFEDRGPHELKGIPGEWRLFAVDRVGA